MQADKKEPAAAAAGKPPSICGRLQRVFQARPAFRPLRRLTVRHQDGGAAKPADAVAGAGPAAPTHGGTPAPAPRPPHPATTTPSPVGGGPSVPTAPPATQPVTAARAPPPGLPVPAPPPGIAAAGAPPAEDAKAQQARVGCRVRKALSSK
ncbi:hypothetical protein ACP4OV_031914 [Aristida adscensionis]